jgi:NADH dehydrogenase [ubiquinone] 1 alpha subcomplex assembly factor 2
MRQLAARADARWAAKPSALDKQADQHQLPDAQPPAESTPKDFAHQAQVQETVGEAARDLAKETPMERQEVVKEEGLKQDTFTRKEQPLSPSDAAPKQEAAKDERPAKTREFKGYKLAGANEQAPASWTPKAARRR